MARVKITVMPTRDRPPIVAVLGGRFRDDGVHDVKLTLPLKPRNEQAATQDAVVEFDRFFSELNHIPRLRRMRTVANAAAEFRVVLRQDRSVELYYDVVGKHDLEAKRAIGAQIARHFNNGVGHELK